MYSHILTEKVLIFQRIREVRKFADAGKWVRVNCYTGMESSTIPVNSQAKSLYLSAQAAWQKASYVFLQTSVKALSFPPANMSDKDSSEQAWE